MSFSRSAAEIHDTFHPPCRRARLTRPVQSLNRRRPLYRPSAADLSRAPHSTCSTFATWYTCRRTTTQQRRCMSPGLRNVGYEFNSRVVSWTLSCRFSIFLHVFCPIAHWLVIFSPISLRCPARGACFSGGQGCACSTRRLFLELHAPSLPPQPPQGASAATHSDVTEPPAPARGLRNRYADKKGRVN